MIPTMLLVGLVFGRWWWATIPVGTIGWVVLLIATDVGSGLGFAFGAAALAALNIIVGVLVYQAIAWMVGGLIRSRAHPQQG